MNHLTELLAVLERGPEYRFGEWPNSAVPQVAAGVYTIWRGHELVYVGMAGRSLTPEHVAAQRSAKARGKGLFSRLGSHAGGRRSGDQFCVYVADRLVMPRLSSEEIAEIGAGGHSLDAYIRTFIHDYLTYRYVEVAGGPEARSLEAAIKSGALSAGPPLLNPSKSGSRQRTA